MKKFLRSINLMLLALVIMNLRAAELQPRIRVEPDLYLYVIAPNKLIAQPWKSDESEYSNIAECRHDDCLINLESDKDEVNMSIDMKKIFEPTWQLQFKNLDEMKNFAIPDQSTVSWGSFSCLRRLAHRLCHGTHQKNK